MCTQLSFLDDEYDYDDEYEFIYVAYITRKNGHVQRMLSKERPAQTGYDSILGRYESLHLCN